MVALAAGSLSAATVSGRIAFVTKRGQKPLPTETLVWLEPTGKAAAKPLAATFQLTTRQKTLLPHVLAVPVGSTVSFPNEDPISHNLFSLSAGNSFDLGLYRRGPGKSKKFDTPGVVNVYCNVHPNMSAVIHVMPVAHYAFADASGSFEIQNVPAGKYAVVAWNEQGGAVRSQIDVPESGNPPAVALTLDSRNFRLTQHLNKEGKPYKAPSSKEY